MLLVSFFSVGGSPRDSSMFLFNSLCALKSCIFCSNCFFFFLGGWGVRYCA